MVGNVPGVVVTGSDSNNNMIYNNNNTSEERASGGKTKDDMNFSDVSSLFEKYGRILSIVLSREMKSVVPTFWMQAWDPQILNDNSDNCDFAASAF